MEEKSIINRLLGLVRLHDDKVKKIPPMHGAPRVYGYSWK